MVEEEEEEVDLIVSNPTTRKPSAYNFVSDKHRLSTLSIQSVNHSDSHI